MSIQRKTWLQELIAIMLIGGYLAYLFIATFYPIAKDAQTLASPLIETLKAAFLILVGFLYGSSQSSQRKDEIAEQKRQEEPTK